MIEDYFALAVNNLFHRRTRSLLTVIGIFIGIAAVVALVSLGQGLQKAIELQFQALGSDKITIMPAGMMTGFGGSSNPLTTSDVDAVRKTPGVQLAGAMLYKYAQLGAGRETKNALVVGIPMDESRKIFEEMQSIKAKEGRLIKPGDNRKVLIGSKVADGMFNRKVRIGDNIMLNGNLVNVVGIMESTGDPSDDKSVYMALDAVRDLFNDKTGVSMILAQTQPGTVPAEVADKIEKRLRTRRGQKEGEEDFSVTTSEQLLQTFNTIFLIVQAVVIGIAAISLLVGGIGIMNTMYTSVLERTKEIGVMKAIGARNGDIMLLFLLESGMLGLIGGIVGVIVGASLGKLTEAIARQALGTNLLQAYLPAELIAGALVFSFLVGTLSGALPARRAASLKPMVALRYE